MAQIINASFSCIVFTRDNFDYYKSRCAEVGMDCRANNVYGAFALGQGYEKHEVYDNTDEALKAAVKLQEETGLADTDIMLVTQVIPIYDFNINLHSIYHLSHIIGADKPSFILENLI